MKPNNEVVKVYNQFEENCILEASSIYSTFLREKMGEAAYYKMLERLTKEEYLVKIGKGLYVRPKKTRFGLILPSEENIVAEYVSGKKGMVIGYQLYNALNISTQVSKNIRVYSNAIRQATKNVRNIHIEQVNVAYTEENRKIIEMMEVLRNYSTIQDFNYSSFISYCENFAREYSEETTRHILESIRYKKSTIAFLRNVLDYYQVKNSLETYLSNLSEYRFPTMEEIYELAKA